MSNINRSDYFITSTIDINKLEIKYNLDTGIGMKTPDKRNDSSTC